MDAIKSAVLLGVLLIMLIGAAQFAWHLATCMFAKEPRGSDYWDYHR